MKSLLFAALLGLAALIAGEAQAYPVTVSSCGTPVTFTAAPKRPVVSSSNMAQTIIDLGLADRFVGYGTMQGIEHHLDATPATIALIRKRTLNPNSVTLEQLLGVDADFYYAGWRYGFVAGTPVSPPELAKLGVKTYALAESCIRIGRRAPISMETVYADTLALGKIFNVEARAQKLVADQRRQVKAITDRTSKAKKVYRVMYCGGCYSDAAPTVIGAEGMPKLLMKLAGGRNIFDDIPDSYVKASWEAIIARDPEWIIISDDRIPAERTIAYLTSSPVLRNVTAIRKRQFVLMHYAERSPSTRNVQALERLAKAMHPDLFR